MSEFRAGTAVLFLVAAVGLLAPSTSTVAAVDNELLLPVPLPDGSGVLLVAVSSSTTTESTSTEGTSSDGSSDGQVVCSGCSDTSGTDVPNPWGMDGGEIPTDATAE